MAYEELQKEFEDISNVHPDLLREIKERVSFTDDSADKGIVNPNSKASIVIRDKGDISLSSSIYAQQKYTANGHAIEQSMASVTETVRKTINANDIVVNNHKLNPALYELCDNRQFNQQSGTSIGNLTLSGTVLVKAWEPTLEKWVLIRRPIRLAPFSPTLNLANAMDQLNISSDISKTILNTSQGGKKE